MEEQTFFAQGNVLVTNARFIVENQTYAINGVTSVKISQNEPSRLLPILILIVGLLICLAGTAGAIIIGLAIASLGGFILYHQKTTHGIVLHSSSGEVQALQSDDEDHIRGVMRALNEAIIHRG